jgi:DNA invertase Pin-like site-specific DNA recombinase
MTSAIVYQRTAISYLRVSTEDQKLGPEAQRSQIETFASVNGIEILETFADYGVSGASPIDERPQLIAALAALKARSASVLLIAKRDRLARDVYIATTIERALPKGCSIVAADGAGNGDEPHEKLIRTILDGMAEYERALIRARTKAALAVKKSKGERVGRPAFGYQLIEGTLTPHPREQEALSRMYAMREQGFTFRAIAAALAADDFTTKQGAPISHVQVSRLVEKPTL